MSRSDASGSGGGSDQPSVGKALRENLRTIRHAEALFEICERDLGEGARVHAIQRGKQRQLFRRDGEVVTPWPLLTLSRIERKRLDGDLGLGPPIEVPPRPEKAPPLRGMGPGHIRLHEGSGHVQVVYREDGLWMETGRGGPAETLRAVLDALASDADSPIERIAAHVCADDPGRYGPGRLLERQPFPDGPAAGWIRGLQAMRRAMHEGKVAADTRWLVADPFERKATHATGDDAPDLDGWEVAAFTRLDPCPLPPHPWGTWARLLGPHGESHFALQQFHANGFTLVGQDAVERVDLDGLAAALDEADRAIPEPAADESEAWKGEQPEYLCRSVRYRLDDGAPGAPAVPHWSASRRGHGSEVEHLLDGALLRGGILRQLWG